MRNAAAPSFPRAGAEDLSRQAIHCCMADCLCDFAIWSIHESSPRSNAADTARMPPHFLPLVDLCLCPVDCCRFLCHLARQHWSFLHQDHSSCTASAICCYTDLECAVVCIGEGSADSRPCLLAAAVCFHLLRFPPHLVSLLLFFSYRSHQCGRLALPFALRMAVSIMAEDGGAGGGLLRRPGAPNDVIQSIPIVPFNPGEAEGTSCAICLDSYQPSEPVRQLACHSTHRFHPPCIDQWLRSVFCPFYAFLPSCGVQVERRLSDLSGSGCVSRSPIAKQ